MDTVESLVRGSIDMHVHHAPDAHIKRSVDALQVALQAEKAGMRAIVLKSHDYPTAPLASIVSRSVDSVSVFGSLCLDFATGGLNVSAVEVSALLGAKVVWMPTFSAAFEMEKKGETGKGITILDEKGEILPVIRDILDIIREHEMVLASGHISTEETFALVDEALEKDVRRIVITHPLETGFGANLTIDEQRQLALKGAFIEHCFLTTMPSGDSLDPREIVKAIREIGADHCILTTDFGQEWNPTPAEGMKMMAAAYLKCGLSVEEIELMIKVNPARLLGLD
ncbi:DUF6282 family protein [Chloroflexota bacterium]